MTSARRGPGPRVARAAALVWVASLGAACGRTSAPPAGRVQPEYDKATGRLERLTYDANGNGTPDTFSEMDGSRVVLVEIDANEDGRIDRWEHYDADQRLEKIGVSRADDGREDAWSYLDDKGAVVRLDLSVGRDGRVTRTEHYAGQSLVRAEEDTDANGTIDKWEEYADGRLARVAFDPSGTGAPTQALAYAADGSVHVESDAGGSRRPQSPTR